MATSQAKLPKPFRDAEDWDPKAEVESSKGADYKEGVRYYWTWDHATAAGNVILDAFGHGEYRLAYWVDGDRKWATQPTKDVRRLWAQYVTIKLMGPEAGAPE